MKQFIQKLFEASLNPFVLSLDDFPSEDVKGIESDWQAVGNYLRKAMQLEAIEIEKRKPRD